MRVLPHKHKKVFVGLSGGVDSATSAALLLRAGYDVTGVFIRIALPGYPCRAGEDKREAMRVAAHLKIPFLEIDFSHEYETAVFKHTVEEFGRGRTPNPDTLCNKEIKFGAFYAFARARGADLIATGHYARIQGGLLYAGADTNKDQSYFLWAAPQEALQHTLFPIGELRKPEVRVLAERFHLPNAERPDSQGLCFLGDISIDDMLEREVMPVPGEVLAEDGSVIGTHHGVPHYTLGQRHGFTLFSQSPDTQPHFVIAKDVEFNTITVSPHRFPRGTTKTVLTLADTNWIGGRVSGACLVRYRYRQKLLHAELSHDGTSVTLAEPHYVPEGQSLVAYDGERCLGGGVIEKAVLY